MKTAINVLWDAQAAIYTAREVLDLIYCKNQYSIILTGTASLILSGLANDYEDIDLIVTVKNVHEVAEKFRILRKYADKVHQCSEYHDESWYITMPNGLKVNICLTDKGIDHDDILPVVPEKLWMTTAGHIIRWKLKYKRHKDIQFLKNLNWFTVEDSIKLLGEKLTCELAYFAVNNK